MTLIFRQLFDPETWTYTYLIGDRQSNEAAFIDPVAGRVDEYLSLLDRYGLKLKYSLETHVHADHITASGELRLRTGALTAVSRLCGTVCPDLQIKDGDELAFGTEGPIQVIATPGHTAGSVSYLWRDRVFTGDALLINGCGRTDFQSGDAGALYDSITQRLFLLPGETLVYPGHDYNGHRVSSIEQERRTNARLAGKTRDEFIDIMRNLKLPKPRLIDEAVPANRLCGLTEEQLRQDASPGSGAAAAEIAGACTPQDLVREAREQIIEVDVAAARALLDDSRTVIIDVREPDEYASGHLPRAINVPRGVLEFRLSTIPELGNPAANLLLYCRTGGRSALAAQCLGRLGFTGTMSLAGGYDNWQAQQPETANRLNRAASRSGK